MIGILVAHSQPIIRDGIASLLDRIPDFKVIGRCANRHQLVRQIRRYEPNITLVQLALPELNGIAGAQDLCDTNTSMKVVALVDRPDQVSVREMADACLSAYLTTHDNPDDLWRAIMHEPSRGVFISARIRLRRTTADPKGLSVGKGLTAREREVLKLIGEGNSSRLIAERLRIAESTVKSHRNNLMDKLATRDVAGLTREAIKLELVEVE